MQQAFRQTADVVRIGGREQKILALLRQQFDYFADVVDEAHVEHAVGFIEHQDLNLGKIHATLLRQNQETSGIGPQDMAAAAQAADLRVRPDAAEYFVGMQLHG